MNVDLFSKESFLATSDCFMESNRGECTD